MRKSVFIKKSLFLLILFYQAINFCQAQDFGRSPLWECWRIENENLTDFAFASDNASEYFLPLTDGSLEAVDKITGKNIWRSELGGTIIAPLIVDQNKLYVVSRNSSPDNSLIEETKGDYLVRAVSISTGITVWQKSLASEKSEKVFLLEDLEKLFIFTENGLTYCIDKLNGRTLFETKIGYKIATVPFLNKDKLHFSSMDGKFVTYSTQNWQIQKTLDLKTIPSTMLVTDNSLYIGDKYGNVSEIMISSGKVRWKAVTGAEIISVTKVKQGLLVSSFDNFIYLLSEKNGKRLWKKRLTGKSIGKPLIKDNVAVFCTLGGSDALFIELDKGKSVNKVLINDENYFINNPSSFNNLIFFPTLKGLIAFSPDKQCSNK